MLHDKRNVFTGKSGFLIDHNRILVLALILLVAGCKQSVHQVREATSRNGIITSAHPLASEAGNEILKKGGNAIDAAVTTAFTLAVVYPRAGNIGGGGFMVFRSNQREYLTLDFRETAPGRATENMFLDSSGQVIKNLSLTSIFSAGVPGSVAGLWAMHDSLGTISWEVLLQPAIDNAMNGFKISTEEANRLNDYADEFKSANPRDIPFVKNTPWKEGDVIKQPELAETLQRIAKNGLDGFYSGVTASHIDKCMTERNGIINNHDLSEYKPIWRKPIIEDLNSFRFILMGLPSSGGIVFMSALKMALPHLDQSKSLNSAENAHVVIESERRAFHDRQQYLGDQDFVYVPVDSLLDDHYLLNKMNDFSQNHATDLNSDHITLPEKFETTHFSIIDKYGNAVAITTTLNGNYGNKIWVPGAGFFLNNEMDDFTLKPGELNQFLLAGGKANAIAPGKRMLSSMCPMIVEQNDSLYLVTGSPGGSAIITTNLQVFLQYAFFNATLSESVNAPRFHHQDMPNIVMMEEGAFHDSVKNELLKIGHQFSSVKYLGCAESIARNKDGSFTGVSDARSDGHVAIP